MMILISSCGKTVETKSDKVNFKPKSEFKTFDNSELQKASDNLGFNIFREEINSKADENIIVSPVSLFTAFNVLVNGTDGNTKKEMKKVLNVEKFTDKELNSEMNNLINYLNNSQRYENTGFIKTYNSIWINDNFKVKDDFINVSKECYDSEVFQVSKFNKDTVNDMNKWISDKSAGLIEKPISDLDEETLMTLFNVLHFKGKWSSTFDKSKTKSEPFYLKNGKDITVDMMNQERQMSYYEDDNVQVGTLNYYNGRMIILLPKGDINKFVSTLKSDDIKNYAENGEYSRVKVKLPAFNVEYKANLNETLKSIGMVSPFQIEKANFSRMQKSDEQLVIDQVLHNCVVNVDEEGTEAAALTAVMLCGSGNPDKINEFYVNKPFLFVIEEDRSNIILFVGKVENPSKN